MTRDEQSYLILLLDFPLGIFTQCHFFPFLGVNIDQVKWTLCRLEKSLSYSKPTSFPQALISILPFYLWLSSIQRESLENVTNSSHFELPKKPVYCPRWNFEIILLWLSSVICRTRLLLSRLSSCQTKHVFCVTLVICNPQKLGHGNSIREWQNNSHIFRKRQCHKTQKRRRNARKTGNDSILLPFTTFFSSRISRHSIAKVHENCSCTGKKAILHDKTVFSKLNLAIRIWGLLSCPGLPCCFFWEMSSQRSALKLNEDISFSKVVLCCILHHPVFMAEGALIIIKRYCQCRQVEGYEMLPNSP